MAHRMAVHLSSTTYRRYLQGSYPVSDGAGTLCIF